MVVNKVRLHKAVSLYLKRNKNLDYTHPEIQRNIERYGVFVDELEVFDRMFWVQPGQSISVINWPRREHGDFEKIRILEENDNIILIFKPFGIVVQPGAGHSKDNLVEWLLQKYPEQSLFDPEKYPTRGLVHRLDKNTQGLLLIAKNLESLVKLQQEFKERNVVKKYLCVADGILDKQYMIKAYQTRDKIDVKRQKLFWSRDLALAYDKQARFAHSVVRPLFYSLESNKSLVEVEIKTGRMHQVRLHMQNIGFPLSSDHIYTLKDLELGKFEQNNVHFEEGWYSLFPIHTPKEIPSKEFNKLQATMFDSQEYCLLSNYLKILLPDRKTIEAELFDTNEIDNCVI